MTALAAVESSGIQEEARVVSIAVSRAAGRLGLTPSELAKAIGVSEAIASQLVKEAYVLQPGKREFQSAVLLARLYRSLDALVGGEDNVAQHWMRNENLALRARPITLVQESAGLVDVINYLDARRAPL